MASIALRRAAAPPREPRELVLVGAGHAHVQVLRSFAMDPPAGCRLTLVVDTPLAVYSGMAPGLVAGQYRPEELEIDAVPLARRAGARVILARAEGIDPAARRLLVAGRPAMPYDLASFDVGSTVAGLDLPGVRERALPTRPIGRFLRRLAAVERAARESPGPLSVVVVGGGAGGVELAFAFWQRLRDARGRHPEVRLVEGAGRLLTGYSEGLARRVERQLERRGIRWLCRRRVIAAESQAVVLEAGDRLACDLLVWVTGAVGQPLWRGAGLPTDGRGFLRVRPTLQALGHDEIFAAGDCATLEEHPDTPKAGVYAVRQGPVLTRNLRAALAGRPLVAYRPQADFLTLLNLGDGTAIGAKRRLAFEGRWVMSLKDRIDRRFMSRFQLLSAAGDPLPALPPMDGHPMVCGGCASKVGQRILARALSRLGPAPLHREVVLGIAEADDASAVELPGGALVVESVDAFRAFTDDPWLVGRVAAVNAVSDLEAKGVVPRWAQALVTLPLAAGACEAEETLVQVLAGARATFDALGVALVGGHTATAAELAVGFAVQGIAGSRAELLRRAGDLAPGMALLLTKPLGTGVLFHAHMAGHARGPWIEAAVASMLRGNGPAARAARQLGAAAATDVTGFGLAGHLSAMLAGSGLAARLELDALPVLPGALELLARGERSSFHAENARLRGAVAVAPRLAVDARLELLFDPQTAGGLLVALPQGQVEPALAALAAAGFPEATVVGQLAAGRPDGALVEVTSGPPSPAAAAR